MAKNEFNYVVIFILKDRKEKKREEKKRKNLLFVKMAEGGAKATIFFTHNI